MPPGYKIIIKMQKSTVLDNISELVEMHSILSIIKYYYDLNKDEEHANVVEDVCQNIKSIVAIWVDDIDVSTAMGSKFANHVVGKTNTKKTE